MRQHRAKIYRKMLHQYQLQFGFREPYQLLIDDTFALALSRYKVSEPLKQFGNVLVSKKVKPLITQCCMAALYALGKEQQSTVDMAKQWERRMCNHREAIDPQDCIKQCVGDHNKHRYIVASERGELRRDLRLAVAGLPMMHFTQAVMVLEPMSPLTKSKIEEKEESKLNLPASEAGLLKNQPKVDVDIIGDSPAAAEGDAAATGDGAAATAHKEGESTRRRKRKAPNPLSVRKPKNPRLTMEEKLQREQELKKQKQRTAARARMEASKPKPTSATPEGTNTEGAKRKRKRSNGKKTSTDATAAATDDKKQQPKANGEAKTESTSTASNDGAAKKRRRPNRKSTNGADATTTATSAAATPAAESSA